MVWLSEHLRIFPNAGEGLAYQIKHNVRGHGVYLFGDWEPRAVWYYFPAALAIKSARWRRCALSVFWSESRPPPRNRSALSRIARYSLG